MQDYWEEEAMSPMCNSSSSTSCHSDRPQHPHLLLTLMFLLQTSIEESDLLSAEEVFQCPSNGDVGGFAKHGKRLQAGFCLMAHTSCTSYLFHSPVQSLLCDCIYPLVWPVFIRFVSDCSSSSCRYKNRSGLLLNHAQQLR